jgi:hypothetical protein
MNDRGFVQSIIHLFRAQFRVFILQEEERVSFGTFNIVIVVDWDIHEVAAVEAKGSALFWFYEDIDPHHFCWAVYNFKVAVGYFVANEEVSAFDLFGLFGAQEGAIDFKLHGRLVVLEKNVLFDGVSLGLGKVSCMED